MSDDTTSSTTRSRTKLYATGSEKLGAFRERNKGAGFLRKEVLVHLGTVDKLAEIAKLEGASVTNTASGLLELGIAQYESLRALGRVVDTPVAANSFSPMGALSLGDSSIGASAVRSFASAQSLQDSSPVLGALSSSVYDPASSVVVNPITSFFEKRKQSLK